MAKILPSAAIVLAASTILVGCSETPASTLSVDSSLSSILVTDSDLPADWTVRDVSDELAKAPNNNTSARAQPAECDSSDKTQLKSGVSAMVSETEGIPGTIITVSREGSDEVIPAIDGWLGKCQAFTVQANGATGHATVRRLEPPATGADDQVGFEMTSTAGDGLESITMTVKGYTARVGDLIVMGITMGGEGASPNGRDVEPDIDMLNTVFTDQVAKAKAA
jgi:hypothetical protein